MPQTAQNLPPQIGRYEIVGRLAMGGMAEILLGRLCGPSGFERPVVVKRILPHLADHGTFVDMFLDEARIASKIQHPNVVQVHELGREDDELFLVMEYLQGESTASLLRRARSRGLLLPPALAAYIASQACAGLHAAHELRDPNGELQNVVHRDISPHNIMVTYAGGVKILDFGIAKAADRISHTEAGQLKGKFEYMSPEQCNGARLDRRSDIFSLGIVLYELLTGHRLFKRAGQLSVLRAVCDEPIPPPTELRDDIPAALSDICMTALRRPPDERYATAGAMRRELLDATRQTPGHPLDELAAHWMERLFPERIEAKRDLLRLVRSGSHTIDVPVAETDGATELPPARDTAPDEEDPTRALSRDEPRAGSEPGPRRRRRLLLVAIIAGVSAIGVALPVWGGQLAPEAADATAEEGEVPVRSDEPSDVVPTNNTAGVEQREADDAHSDDEPGLGSAEQTEGEAGAAADRKHVTVRVTSEPMGAQVRIAGEKRGETPVDVVLPRGQDEIDILVDRRGYRIAKETIVPDVDQRIRVDLSRKPRRRPRRPRPDDGEEPSPSSQDSPDDEGFHRFE